MSKLVLDAQTRVVAEKKARHLRNEGLIPVTAYGPGNDPVSLVVEIKSLEATLRAGGNSRLVEVHVNDGSVHNVLVREVQRHPINHRAMHADFYLVRMDQKQQVSVPLIALGTPSALASGLMVLQNHESIEIEALPADIPSGVEVDITNLNLNNPITIKNLPALDGIVYLGDPDEALIVMAESQAGAELDALLEEDAAEALEAAEEEGGAEPEVVGRGKDDEDEEEK
jgi:large subunit ribosomal protein L25